MKKLFARILVLALILSLTACGSSPAKDVEAIIASIGETTIESGSAIRGAREAYEALSEEERGKVGNYALLEQAEEEFRLLQARLKVEKVEELIARISEPPESTGEERRRIIEEAREAYDQLPEELQKMVDNLALLTEAEDSQPFAEIMALEFELPESFVTPIQIRFTPVESNDDSQESVVLDSAVSLPVPEVTCSEPDEDGYVVYTITIKTEVRQGLERDELYPNGEKGGWFCFAIDLYGIYDYYTGRYLGSSEDVSTCPVDGLKIYHSVIPYNGVTYDITFKESGGLQYEGLHDAPFFEDRSTSTVFFDAVVVEYTCDDTVTIRVPKDYDGLMIAIRGLDEEIPEYEDMENYDCEKHAFTVEAPAVRYWEGNPENWLFIRVNDLL